MEKGEERSERKVMVVIDESEHSYNALIWVLDNLKEQVANSSMIIFVTQPYPNYSYASTAPQLGSAGLYYTFGPNQALIKSAQQRTKRISEGLCERAKSICASRGVFIEAITEAGEPKEVICSAVYNHGIDLLVVPNYDNSYCLLKRVFVESLSEYCLRNATCPVLLVQQTCRAKKE